MENCQNCVYYHLIRTGGIDWCGLRPDWHLVYEIEGMRIDYLKPCSLIKACGYCDYRPVQKTADEVAEMFGAI